VLNDPRWRTDWFQMKPRWRGNCLLSCLLVRDDITDRRDLGREAARPEGGLKARERWTPDLDQELSMNSGLIHATHLSLTLELP